MSMLLPSELLKQWKLEQAPIEMTLGHVVQNLARLHSELEANHTLLRNLRAEVDRLMAHTRLPPIVKDRQKLSKPDETSDPEQAS
jgi:hypothetical protein